MKTLQISLAQKIITFIFLRAKNISAESIILFIIIFCDAQKKIDQIYNLSCYLKYLPC